MSFAIGAIFSLITIIKAADVAHTPPMGFNTCALWRMKMLSRSPRQQITPHQTAHPAGNLYHCGTDAAILKATGQAFVDYGLAKVGYIYVNTECVFPRARLHALQPRCAPFR